MSHSNEVERRFSELRDYFQNRGHNEFDLQDLRGDIIRRARRGETIEYGTLLLRYKISRGGKRGIGTVLGTLSELEPCRQTGCRDPPHLISAIVVRADTGYPSGGFFGVCDVPEDLQRDEREYRNPELTEDEKNYVDRVQRHLKECESA